MEEIKVNKLSNKIKICDVFRIYREISRDFLKEYNKIKEEIETKTKR